MSIVLDNPWPQQDPGDPFASLADLRQRQQQQQPLQLIQLTPWVPPPRTIQPSRHFAPSSRRVMRTPSLSTITDRRESGTSFEVSFPSSSSYASSRRSSYRRPPLDPRRLSSESSDSTLSSESQHTMSGEGDEPQPAIVQVHAHSPTHSLARFPSLRRSSSLPRVASPQPVSQDALPLDQPPDATITALRKHDPLPPVADLPFSPLVPPTLEQLSAAADLDVLDQHGNPVRFGTLFADQTTIVCFIRHFWCPLCQDYMYSVTREVDPVALEEAGVKMVIISNGSPAMIRSYRQIFRLPASIPLFTDPSRTLYRTLGMTLRTMNAGPDEEKGDYVRHGQLSGTVMVIKNAFKHRLPIYAKGGDIKQLGGEFILGPGLQCHYTSRMSTTRSHTSIPALLARAGVELVTSVDSSNDAYMSTTLNSSSKTLRNASSRDATWESTRKEGLRGICERRLDRRGGLKHLRWVGDCGLYEGEESSPSSETHAVPCRELNTMHSERLLSTAYHEGWSDRARALSDPGPGLVAEWLEGLQQQTPSSQ